MRLPQDLGRAELVKGLRALGYTGTGQTESHLRITTQVGGEHHEVIPNHSPLKLGTLRSILRSVASHHQLSVDELALKIGL